MGGTSFDVALVASGQPTFAQQTSVDFGLVVRTPMIEITTIGAGGGSIAAVDAAGILKVGPESAGSDPGPASYGRGNDRPTVTDANLALGRIDPDRPLGRGLERLDVEAARGQFGPARRRAARAYRRAGGRSGNRSDQRTPCGSGPSDLDRARSGPGELLPRVVRRRRGVARRCDAAGDSVSAGPRTSHAGSHQRAWVRARGSATRRRTHDQHSAGRSGSRNPARRDVAYRRVRQGALGEVGGRRRGYGRPVRTRHGIRGTIACRRCPAAAGRRRCGRGARGDRSAVRRLLSRYLRADARRDSGEPPYPPDRRGRSKVSGRPLASGARRHRDGRRRPGRQSSDLDQWGVARNAGIRSFRAARRGGARRTIGPPAT